ncbi:hypothetical protein BASA50_010622 [Batrachochytrium salamandrivorans]|uniref:protein-tyrosine-phosphatase n=1 Tax=Batrachochytrium salamandrivorans TaxID=1357716 RepID=A0ABQ8EZ63_9FUNG|nr:hypothetical protein BASA50_010622 [Batrachochytrium salamandrivorans]
MPFSTLGGLMNHTISASGGDILTNSREFIKGKLYFACLDSTPPQCLDVHFFTVDQQLTYINFYSDFGPNNLSHVMRFCEILHAKFNNPATCNKKICLYSSTSADKRANSAFLICSYMMIVQRNTPEEAYQSLMGISPPFVPYRDAGYGAATYHITVLDCIRGLYKALQLGLLDLENLDLKEYEFYERVENGDFNWITSKFLALASPKDDPPTFQQQQLNPSMFSTGLNVSNLFYTAGAAYATPHIQQRAPALQVQSEHEGNRQLFSAYNMDNLIRYLQENGIKTIIRLNNKTYDKRKFIEAGIEHIELYFPDGTTPPDAILKRFLDICEAREGPIAVHCKAGLGRTGSLIASYIMKHYKMTACEVISFMRVLRPGSIVGPQQNYLQAMQPRLWKMHPSNPLPLSVSCWTAPTYPNLTRFGGPVFSNMGTAVNVMQQQQQQQQRSSTQHPQSSIKGANMATRSIGDSTLMEMDNSYDQDNESRSEFSLIRGGYSNVDAYEAELQREREAVSLGELLIPGQPRKQQIGVSSSGVQGSSKHDANITGQPQAQLPMQSGPQMAYNHARHVSSGQQYSYSSHPQFGNAQPRYNLRSHSSIGAGTSVATSSTGNNIPRAMVQGYEMDKTILNAAKTQNHPDQSQDCQLLQEQQVDNMSGLGLVKGRVISPTTGSGRK